MNIFGYIFLSSSDPDGSAQRKSLLGSGVAKNNIFWEKGDSEKGRPIFNEMVKCLSNGDRVVIAGIEYLGQSYREIVDCLTYLIKEKGVHLTVLDMPLLSSTTAHGAMDSFVSEVMLELLTYLTRKERSIRQERQAEGIAAAKDRGVRFGKPALERPQGYETLRDMWVAGGLSSRAAARQLNVSHQTFLKWAKSEQATQ